MKRLSAILIISVLYQLAAKCSSQLLAASLAGNRGASNAAVADPGWASTGYGLRAGSGYNSMPMDPSLAGPYSVPYNNYPPLGSSFMPSSSFGLSPPGLGVPPSALTLPPSGLGSPVGYGGFNSPYSINSPSVGMPYSSIGSGVGFTDPNALAVGNPSGLAFQQPAYTMPIVAQPQTTQMTENENANTNININHDMGLHHPGMPKGLLGLTRM